VTIAITHRVQSCSPCDEGYYADNPAGTTGNLLTQMTTAGHAERRKIWDRAFTPSALQSYEPLLEGRVSELVDQLSARVGTQIDIAEWVRCVGSPRPTIRADDVKHVCTGLHG
jgi:cytochrome P450